MKKQTILSTALTAALFGTVAAAAAASGTGVLPVMKAPAVNTIGQSGAQNSINGFIVTYRDGSTQRSNAAAATASFNSALSRSGVAAARVGATAGTARYVRRLATGSTLFEVKGRVLDRAQVDAVMRSVAADPNVLRVEPDYIRRPIRNVQAPAALALPTAFTPNDPLFAKYHWNYKPADGAPTSAGLANNGGSNVTNGWDLADGNGIVVAVLDTGTTAHPDIDNSLAADGYDFLTKALYSGRATDGRVAGGWDTGDWTTESPWLETCTDADNPPSDSSWHGTNVGSVIGAERTNNSVGMSGIAYNAKVLPVRVLGHCGGPDSDIADAIVWAAGGDVAGVPKNRHPANIINMSLGGPGACSATSTFGAAIKKANDLGAIVVVAAGNSARDAGGYSPASCPGVITVASNGYTSRRAYYSNYGETVEISAPGGGVFANDGNGGSQLNPDGFIWSAMNMGSKTPVPEAELDPATAYGGMAGTSQASPHVAGILALMQGARLEAGMPLLKTDEAVQMLQRTATTFAVAPSSTQPIGPGIVNAGAAVKAAIEPPCTENCGPVATPLALGVQVKNLAGGDLLYSVEAKAGKTLSIITAGGTGDLSLYVSFGKEPSADSAEFRSTRKGNNETVRVSKAKEGTYYVKLSASPAAFKGVTLLALQ